MEEVLREFAINLFQKAYQLQRQGDLDNAVILYKQSIKTYPTAEAHTFLGWTYRGQGKLDLAIEECLAAIEVDPAFGHPYNDIGAYLIEKGKLWESIPWLEKATQALRFESHHYPWYNLGRVYLNLEMLNKAKECFEKAIVLRSDYVDAKESLRRLRSILQ
jgi:tetratricopeptide (TPR) repeat protein